MGIMYDEKKYGEYLNVILNYNLGSKYLLFMLYILMPIIAFFMDGFETWYSSGSVNLFLFTETFIFCEAIVSIIIVIRFLRDYVLKRKFLPDRTNIQKVKKSITYIKMCQEKAKSKDRKYNAALEKVLNRNNDILNI